MVKYEGLFFDKETESLILALDKERLDVGIDVLHCTFKYLPSEEEIFTDYISFPLGIKKWRRALK